MGIMALKQWLIHRWPRRHHPKSTTLVLVQVLEMVQVLEQVQVRELVYQCCSCHCPAPPRMLWQTWLLVMQRELSALVAPGAP